MKQNITKLLIFLVLLWLLLLGVNFYISTEIAVFTDPNLEELIREKLNRPEGNIYSFHLQSIKELDATGKDIESLEGIEILSGLTRLNLEDNRVKDVTPLRHLHDLKDLSLRNNYITDLSDINFDSIKSLPLKRLSLRHNVVRPPVEEQIRLSDINILKHFHELEELELRDNHIENITPLGELTGLKILDICQNPLEDGDISALKEMTGLLELNLRETNLKDITPISGLTELIYLNIHSNPDLSTIAPVQNLTKLETLIMRNVTVGKELKFIVPLKRLNRLNMRNCNVSDLTALGELMEIGALQDHPAKEIKADVDIRENPIPTFEDKGVDGYAPVREHWQSISYRQPESLPN